MKVKSHMKANPHRSSVRSSGTDRDGRFGNAAFAASESDHSIDVLLADHANDLSEQDANSAGCAILFIDMVY